MKHPPILPTLIVAAAALLMVRLGFWQLRRLHEKEVLVALSAANLSRPAVPFASLRPIAETALYRRVTADCPAVRRWKAEAGRSVAQVPGWRHIAFCTGDGPAVDVGTSGAPDAPKWTGGPIRGRLTWAPTGQPLVARLFAAPRPCRWW